MIKTYLFTGQGVTEDVPLEDWRSAAHDADSLLWVDVRSYSSDEIHQLVTTFGLHSVAADSCLDGYQRPHLYEFKDHFYVNLTVLKSGSHVEHGLKPAELHLFVGEKLIITASRDPDSEAVNKALAEYLGTPAICARGPMHAVYLLAEVLVETYYPVAEKLDDEADRLETVMLDHADKKSLSKLFRLKRRCFDLRKLLGPQRDVFSELTRRDFPFMEGENQVYFQDVYNRMIRLFDMMDTIREVLSGSLDIYLSTVSNRLNEVMKVLTVAATILMTMALITGFYGMNFVHLPWLRAPNAFRNVLIFMGVLTAGMLMWFKRKGWM
jgi:magnesium transporter